jgi:nucleoside 2-deoxyribosyltransferase
MIPVVYVAGPYRAPNRAGVELNIQAARHVGKLCCVKGWSPIIPHANTGHLDETLPGLQDEFWLESTMELLRRADAVVLVPGWEMSSGTRAEIAEATLRGIPVYDALHLLPSAQKFVEDKSSEPQKIRAGVRL